ncbi:hypothetical protein AFLA_011573 [Aspergillus flavus NRRL3357]|nr:hypothetical protein AFLA_011573 [Aspergillus flavus NRRL3357]
MKVECIVAYDYSALTELQLHLNAIPSQPRITWIWKYQLVLSSWQTSPTELSDMRMGNHESKLPVLSAAISVLVVLSLFLAVVYVIYVANPVMERTQQR